MLRTIDEFGTPAVRSGVLSGRWAVTSRSAASGEPLQAGRLPRPIGSRQFALVLIRHSHPVRLGSFLALLRMAPNVMRIIAVRPIYASLTLGGLGRAAAWPITFFCAAHRTCTRTRSTRRREWVSGLTRDALALLQAL